MPKVQGPKMLGLAWLQPLGVIIRMRKCTNEF